MENTLTATELIRHWDDIDFTAVASFDPEYPDTHVKLTAYKIEARELVVGHDAPIPRAYELAGSDNPMDWTGDITKAQAYLQGSVKWDGCSNWQFDAQEQAMLHFCDADDAANIGVLFRRLYEWAKELGMDRD